MTALSARGVSKTYGSTPPVEALRAVDLDVEPGERVVISGPSGAGKSTLLNILGLLDAPSTGEYRLLGHDTSQIRGRHRDRLRAQTLGFVFQDSHVLGHRTVSENIELKLTIARTASTERDHLIGSALDQVGLTHRRHAMASLLSGGERQRLAVARAMVNQPRVLLADEPTGNLDDANASTLLSLFDQHASTGVAVVVITHSRDVADWADRVVTIRDGRLSG
jgi:ABC-type lipoprotein export system ATPase subunit